MDHSYTGGELVCIELNRQKKNTIFTLVGNLISPILLNCKKNNISLIEVRHEQGAIHMAEGWTKATKDLGVAIVSGGPAFANSVAGIVKCYMSNTPLLVITGAIRANYKDRGSLQDINQLNLVKEYLKWSATVHSPERIPEYIDKAIKMATGPYKGPVVLEIPLDTLSATCQNPIFFPEISNNKSFIKSISFLKDEMLFIEKLKVSKRPIIIIGNEFYYSNGLEQLLIFLNSTQIPIFTVGLARGQVSDSNELCFGNGRILDSGPQIYAYRNSDLIISIGVEFDYQMDFTEASVFNERTEFIEITNAPTLFSNSYKLNTLLIESDITSILENINKNIINNITLNDFSLWRGNLQNKYDNFYKELHDQNTLKSYLRPVDIFTILNEKIKDKTTYVLDGSNAMFWGGTLARCQNGNNLLIAPDSKIGPMGTGIPLALGVKLANPNQRVILYTGDGSFGFNAMELDTAIRFKIPIIIIIHNDSCWGFCESTQDLIYNQVGSTNLHGTDYAKITIGMGGRGYKVTTLSEFESSISEALVSDTLSCIDIRMDKELLSPGTTAFNESIMNMK